MRMKRTFKSFTGRDGDTPPAPYPSVVQDALYSDNYELHKAEQQALNQIMDTIDRMDRDMAETRKRFEEMGGTFATGDDGTMVWALNGQSITIARPDVPGGPVRLINNFTLLGSDLDRKALRNAVRAHVCQHVPAVAKAEIERGATLLNNIHTIRGVKKVADESIKHGANLDELARGAIVWDEDDETTAV